MSNPSVSDRKSIFRAEKVGRQGDETLDRAAKPIELPDHDTIPGTREMQGFRQSGPIGLCPARLIGEQLFAPGLVRA